MPSRTILYIEDSSVNCVLMELIVKKIEGLELVSVMSAETGLELAESLCPELIIVNFHLPGMDGIKATQLLKESETTKDIPVVIVSSDHSPEKIKKALKAGCLEYITTPLNIQNTIATIDRITNPSSQTTIDK